MNQYNADTGQEEDQYVKRFKALFPTLHKHPMEFNNVNYQLQIATYKGVQYLDFLLRDAHLNTKLHATSLPGDKDYNTWYIEVALNSIYNSIRTSDNFNSKLSKTFTRNQRDWYSDGNLVWMYETQTQNSIFDIEFNKNVKESKKMVKKITESDIKMLVREALMEEVQKNKVVRISESDLKKIIREAIEDFNLPKPNPNAKYLDEQCIELSRQLENRCKQEERRYGMNRQQMLKIATNFIGSQISRFDIPTAEYIGNLSDKASDYYSRFDAHREYVQNIDDETFNNDIERFGAIYGGNESSNEGNSFDAEENRIASSVDTAKKCLSDPNTVIIFVFYSDERVCYFLKRQDFENALRKDKAYNNDNKLTNSKLGFGTVVNKDEPKIRMSQGVK